MMFPGRSEGNGSDDKLVSIANSMSIANSIDKTRNVRYAFGLTESISRSSVDRRERKTAAV